MSNPLYLAANKFVGNPNIKWSQDYRSVYVHTSRGEAIDFKLNYWKDGADIPEPIQKIVRRKFEHIFEQPSGNQVSMCCYHFCFLACLEAGIITEEQINKIFCICRALRPETDPYIGGAICAGHAFYNGITAKQRIPFDAAQIPDLNPKVYSEQTYERLYNDNLSDYVKYQNDNASPGDLLLHFHFPSNNPFHYSIYAGNGEIIEHNIGAECRKGPWEKMSDDEVIRIVPYDKIAANISEFIKNHEHFCDLERDKMSIQDFLWQLEWGSDYKDLITKFSIDIRDETGKLRDRESILIFQ